MNRRAFVSGALLVFATPFDAQAQQTEKVACVGVLSSGWPSPSPSPAWRGFQDGLRDLGWTEGRDLVLEPRFAEGPPDRLPALAQDLLRLNVDVSVTFGPLPIRLWHWLLGQPASESGRLRHGEKTRDGAPAAGGC